MLTISFGIITDIPEDVGYLAAEVIWYENDLRGQLAFADDTAFSRVALRAIK